MSMFGGLNRWLNGGKKERNTKGLTVNQQVQRESTPGETENSGRGRELVVTVPPDKSVRVEGNGPGRPWDRMVSWTVDLANGRNGDEMVKCFKTLEKVRETQIAAGKKLIDFRTKMAGEERILLEKLAGSPKGRGEEKLKKQVNTFRIRTVKEESKLLEAYERAQAAVNSGMRALLSELEKKGNRVREELRPIHVRIGELESVREKLVEAKTAAFAGIKAVGPIDEGGEAPLINAALASWDKIESELAAVEEEIKTLLAESAEAEEALLELTPRYGIEGVRRLVGQPVHIPTPPPRPGDKYQEPPKGVGVVDPQGTN